MCGANIWDIFIRILYVLQNNVNSAAMDAVFYVSSHVELANIRISMCVLILLYLSYQFQSDVLKSLISLRTCLFLLWFCQFLLYSLCFDAVQLVAYISLELRTDELSVL